MIYELVKKYIEGLKASGHIRLAATRELCAKFGVSRPTLAKALAQLEMEGVITRKRGSGIYIKDCGPDKSLSIALGVRNGFLDDEHFTKLMSCISKYAQKYDVELHIFDQLIKNFKRDKYANNIVKSIENKTIDGFLVLSRMPIDILAYLNSNIPLAVINNVVGTGDVMCVACDFFQVGFRAADYLIGRGHKDIAFLCLDIAHPEVVRCLSGFQMAFSKINRKFDLENIFEVNSNEKRKQIIELLKKKKFTACYFVNDATGEMFIKAMRPLGLKIPEDVSIVGTGNLDGSERLNFTTVETDIDFMCMRAFEMLIEKIKGKKAMHPIELLTPEIVERDSVKDLSLPV
jgi:LacI family transcriptional regulator